MGSISHWSFTGVLLTGHAGLPASDALSFAATANTPHVYKLNTHVESGAPAVIAACPMAPCMHRPRCATSAAPDLVYNQHTGKGKA